MVVETVPSNYLNPDIYCKEKELAKKNQGSESKVTQANRSPFCTAT